MGLARRPSRSPCVRIDVPPPLALYPDLHLCGFRVLYPPTLLARGAHNSFLGAGVKCLGEQTPGKQCAGIVCRPSITSGLGAARKTLTNAMRAARGGATRLQKLSGKCTKGFRNGLGPRTTRLSGEVQESDLGRPKILETR